MPTGFVCTYMSY